ncbi:MAG: hypothetical protein QF674_03980 [Candidatus Marinimicrobia bacterium]|jgi:hypothetical protein|nr:hypothetical protein [Candidatus Neomarinimicrobiota bacterium]MDP7122431.1 hypothetical protein [Candidatus Neomarinimicrobiota bacterium]MDP7715866.1 hypothetical protein [Candidatus Neomarinimicrobiota bacterium]HJM09991.1 hypothetical protein [Candidatus Neomarinimicrobiota bacterium]|tara:strand:- start:239 stop:454 length:216 start_codon:yes stop_codon:yes gene_type:complete
MRTSGIFMVLSGSAIIVFYIIYELLKVIVFIPSKMRIAVALIVLGGLLLLGSVIKDRVNDSKKETFKGVRS